MPLISVIMSTYNENKSIVSKAVDSIIHQTLSDYEFIIVLDNPCNTEVRNLLEQYRKNDNRIILIYNEKNIGLTASLNRALRACKGDYIARMDADDIAHLNRLEEQYKYINDNDLDISGTLINRIDENDEIIAKARSYSYPPECIEKLLLLDNCVPHPSWMVKQSVYKKLNGYRDIKTCEDYDFLLRAICSKYRIGIVEQVLLDYRINFKGISRSNALRQRLSSCYLKRNINRIDDVNQEEIDIYLSKHYSDEAEEKYNIANTEMNVVLEKIKNGRIIYFWGIIPLCFKSKYIIGNIIDIAKMFMIKKSYKINR